MEGLPNGMVFTYKYHEKREEDLQLESRKRAFRVVRTASTRGQRGEWQERRPERRRMGTDSLHRASSIRGNGCGGWDSWLKQVHCILQVKLYFLHAVFPFNANRT